MTGFTILFLFGVIWFFNERLKESEKRSLMWENRAIRLVGELRHELERTYFFTDEKNGIDYEEREHEENIYDPNKYDDPDDGDWIWGKGKFGHE